MGDQSYDNMASVESSQLNSGVNQAGGVQDLVEQGGQYENIDVNNSMSLPSRPLEGEELKRALIEQLEHVFSKEYLASDPFLVSRLSADFYAPISVIEELPIIKSLTTDSDLIHSALRASKGIVFDEGRQAARPVVQLHQRNTIILRDIPENTTVEDIRALVHGTKFEAAINWKETKPDHGNTFFIQFTTEPITQEAWKHLRQQSLGGKPVQARIKSENIVKSVWYASQQQSAQSPVPPPSQPIPLQSPSSLQGSSQPAPFYPSNGARPYSSSTPPNARNNRGYKTPNSDGTWNRPYDSGKSSRSPQWSGRKGKEYRGGGKSFENKGSRSARGAPRHPKKGGFPHDRRNVVPISQANWPPLGAEDNAQNATGTVGGTDQSSGPESVIPIVPVTSTTDSSAPDSGAPPMMEFPIKTDTPTDPTVPAPTDSNPSSAVASTVWAVSNSAVKQPPPKRVPNSNVSNGSNGNNSAKKNRQQKQNTQTNSPPNQSGSTNNSNNSNSTNNSNSVPTGKWKEAKTGKRSNRKNVKRSKNSNKSSNSGSSNESTSSTPIENDSHTNTTTTSIPTTTTTTVTTTTTATSTPTSNTSTNSANTHTHTTTTDLRTDSPSGPAYPTGGSGGSSPNVSNVDSQASAQPTAANNSAKSSTPSYADVVRPNSTPPLSPLSD